MIAKTPILPVDGFDDLDFGPGPYDGSEAEEDAPQPLAEPRFGPRACGTEDLDQWRRAQAAQAADLADVAHGHGQLVERLRSAPAGGQRRLALLEVADLGWWAGEHVGLDRLILAAEDRLAGVQDQSLALSALLWSLRRLVQPQGPGQDAVTIAAFLGRSRAEEEPGADLRGLAADLARAGDLHPVVRGAMVFHHWRASGPGGLTRDLEAAVLGARVAGSGAGMGGHGFVPLALSSGAGLRASGAVDLRLQAWLQGAARAISAALLHLDRLTEWRARATARLADLSGRTPTLLAGVLADWPVVSAPLAERETGASRAAVQRNLAVMQDRGLIREMSGQGRFRLWTAKI